MTFKELKNKIPHGWEQITLDMYLNVMKQNYHLLLEEDDEGFEKQELNNSLIFISALTGIEVNDITKNCTYAESVALANHVRWIETPPQPYTIKPVYMKDGLDLTLSNYLVFEKCKYTDIKDVEKVLNFFIEPPVKYDRSYKNLWMFWKKDIPMMQASQMNMVEIVSMFFFVKTSLLKSFKRFQYRLLMQMTMNRIKALF